MHFAQQPGDLPRSGIAQSGTETAIHMKKYLIPAALIGDHEAAGSFFVAYFLTGRFNIYKEYTLYPSRAAAHGEPSDWANFCSEFAALESEPKAQSLKPCGKGLFPPPWAHAVAQVDAGGLPWLVVEQGGVTRRVGITTANLLAPGSDATLAFQLMLAA